MECPDCEFLLPRLVNDNRDVERFIDWPSESKHPDQFIVAACGTGTSVDDKGRMHAVTHNQLGTIARATVSNTFLINNAREFPEKQCFAALTKYGGFMSVEWSEATKNISLTGAPMLPRTVYYDVAHVKFDNPVRRLEISTSDFSSLFRTETPTVTAAFDIRPTPATLARMPTATASLYPFNTPTVPPTASSASTSAPISESQGEEFKSIFNMLFKSQQLCRHQPFDGKRRDSDLTARKTALDLVTGVVDKMRTLDKMVMTYTQEEFTDITEAAQIASVDLWHVCVPPGIKVTPELLGSMPD